LFRVGGMPVAHFLTEILERDMINNRPSRFDETALFVNKTKIALYAMIVLVILFQLRDAYIDFRTSMLHSRKSNINYSNYFENPILQELSKQRPDFHNYRIVTIQYPTVEFKNLPGVNSTYGFETADGYNSSFPKRYLDFWKMIVARDGKYPHVFPGLAYVMVDIAKDNCIDLLSLANVEYVISLRPLRSRRLIPVSLTGSNKVGRHITPLFIYRNSSMLPRCFAPEYIEIFQSKEDLTSELKKRTAKAFRKRALLVQEDIGRLDIKNGSRNEIQISNYRVSGDRVSFDTDSKKGGLVVVLNSYSPYWKVVKGGSYNEVFPVYHAFQGVFVKPGRQEVTIEYCPPYIDKLKKYL